MKECPDEGRLQGFFDGELPVDMMEKTARHIAACATCARASRELESENAIFLRALEPEMSVSVPTEQLRTRIAEAVAQMNSPARSLVRESVPGRSPWWSSLSVLFRFTPLRATAFASILAVVILGSILAALRVRNGRNATTPSDTGVVKVAPRGSVDNVAVVHPVPVPTSAPITSTSANPGARPNRARPVDNFSSADRVAGVKLIPGEKSYLKTIAALDVNLKGGRRAMTPATRAEYERNLKLVDYAIAATRSKAKRTPHDPDAAEFMFAAYQSKIDLLSTMTEQARLTQH
jgi:hypothetical protein